MESYLNGISPAALFTVVFSIVFLAILLLLLCLLVHRRIWRIGLLTGTFILVAFAATFYSAVQLQLERRAAREQVYQKVEQLQKERGQLEKQLYRARATGDGYAQIRFRTLLEQNREALEKLIPKQ